MPRTKRWIPISQGFNDDPETWEFANKIGDRALRTLLEIFRIIEETENHWRLTDGWLASISRKVRQTPASIRLEVDWMLASHWLEVDQRSADGQPEVLRARNYLKFHPTKGTQQIPTEKSTSSPPSFPSFPSSPKENLKRKGNGETVDNSVDNSPLPEPQRGKKAQTTPQHPKIQAYDHLGRPMHTPPSWNPWIPFSKRPEEKILDDKNKID